VTVAQDQLQVFVSYSRDDNLPPPGFADRKGFVEFLQNYLNYKFRSSGPLRPAIWRDTDNIADGEPFPQRLKDELDRSAFLLVVLSQNWLNSKYCLQELEYFCACRKARDEPANERIVIVEKYPVDLKDRPAQLPTAVGYKFYRLTDRPVLPIDEFFSRGEAGSDYWTVFDSLFAYLQRAVARMTNGKPPAAPPTNGRTVFVAKPATDMHEEYIRLVAELTGKGYAVVPPRMDEFPHDGSAQSFVDTALAKAELSIHLLGESAGWKPENSDEIVKLQLARAAARTEIRAASPGATANPPFHRIIWVPKVFTRDPRAAGETVQRDPYDVLGRFGADCNGDRVYGDDFSSFRETLVSYLDRLKRPSAPVPDDAATPPPGKYAGKIYVLHHENDRELARRLRKALSEYKVEAILPVRDGDEVQRDSLNMDFMRGCDGVVICWGSTTECWTRTQARQFDNWRQLGRSQAWEPRGILLGPPPASFKNEFQEDPLPSEIDTVVVINDLQSIPPDELRKLIPRRPPA
jgi:TIR domain